MTEIITSESRSKKTGFGQAKRHSLRIDMTPMVDLGFLLITFFIYTSTIREPSSMSLIMPDEQGPPTKIKQSGALTLIPGEDQKVYYYEGEFEEGKLKTSTIREVRRVIVDKKARTPVNDLVITIKPSKYSNYRTVVDVLDEMIISDVRRYALVKIAEAEEKQIN